jgi:type IV pilus assembly protein PilN
MPHINLLPWRDQLRQQNLKFYQGTLGGVVVVALAITLGFGVFVDSLVDGQTARNNYLNQQIAVLDQQIVLIKSIKEKREALQLKINLIEQLQQSRNLTTNILSEIVSVTPSGIYLERLKSIGNSIRIEGKTESNIRLSEMIRRVENSALLAQPAIESIIAVERAQRPVSNFIMTLTVNVPELASQSGVKQ